LYFFHAAPFIWVVGTFQYKRIERKSNGFSYLTTIGDFRPAMIGGSRPTLTVKMKVVCQPQTRT